MVFKTVVFRENTSMIDEHQLTDHFITDPLPRQIRASRKFLFMGVGMVIVSLLVGVLMKHLDILPFLFPLFFIGFAIFLAILMFRSQTDYLRFETDRIILATFFNQKIYYVQDIKDIQIIHFDYRKEHLFRKTEVMSISDLVIKFPHSKLALNRHTYNEPLSHIMGLMVYHYKFKPNYTKWGADISHTQFGKGSKKPFPHYFKGDSQVNVKNVSDICDWLRQCQYVHDHVQFNAEDVWLHPLEFEKRQQGDCEDHALWAWRKLEALYYRTEFVIGHKESLLGQESLHAWVTFEENGRSYLIETTKKTGNMVFPLKNTRKEYHPLLSVDQNFLTYRY